MTLNTKSNLEAFERLTLLSQDVVELLRSTFEEKLRAAGLEPPIERAAPVLVYLRCHGKSILSDLAAGCGRQSDELAETAKQLEQNKLVAREQDAEDKSLCRLELTELGEKYAAIAQATRDDVDKILFGSMPPAEQAQFKELFRKVLEGMKKGL